MRSLGCIRETKDKNIFRIVISQGRDAGSGKRVRRWLTVRGARRDAERRLNEILHDLNTGVFVKPAKASVRDFLNLWLADYAKSNLSPRSFERYSGIIKKHLIPDIGNVLLTQLKPEHVQKHYNDKLNDGLCAGTVLYHHSVLHRALKTAQRWGLVTRNVTDSVEIPRINKAEMQIWNESEVNQFLDAAKDTPYYALFFIALYSGARRGELLGLKWHDCDFIYSQVFIERSLHKLKNGSYIFTQPKSSHSRRTIALSPTAILTLKSHHDKAAMDRAMIGVQLSDDDLVFSTIDGKPLHPETVSIAWKRIARKAGVKVISLHGARHTHASLLLKMGVHPKICQERLGHSSIKITLDIYSHISPGLQEAAALRFDENLQLGRNWVENSVK